MRPWRLSVHTAAPVAQAVKNWALVPAIHLDRFPHPGSGRAPRPDLSLGADRGVA